MQDGLTELRTASDRETEALGHRLAAHLRPGVVVALHGDLGAGKTVLTRGIARGLRITEPVTSPTFTIVQEYRRPDGSWLYHLDMYRIRGPAEALAFGVEEFLFAANGITVVEWPERLGDLLDLAGRQPQPQSVPPACIASPTGEGRPVAPQPPAPCDTVYRICLEHVDEGHRRIRLPESLLLPPF